MEDYVFMVLSGDNLPPVKDDEVIPRVFVTVTKAQGVLTTTIDPEVGMIVIDP